MPAMKAKQLSKAKVLSNPLNRTLAAFVNGLADLAQPKASLPVLADTHLLNAYQAAIKGALQELPGKTAVIFRTAVCVLMLCLYLASP